MIFIDQHLQTKSQVEENGADKCQIPHENNIFVYVDLLVVVLNPTP